MSDQPLFQNSDEQEAAYAPQELAAGDPAARRPTGDLNNPNAGVLAGGTAGALGAAGSVANTSGLPAAGAAPVAGTATTEAAAEEDEPGEARGTQTGGSA